MIDHWWPIFCQIDFPLYCFSCLYIKFIFTGTTNTFRFREEITISKRRLMMKIFFTFKVNNQFWTSLRNQKKKKLDIQFCIMGALLMVENGVLDPSEIMLLYWWIIGTGRGSSSTYSVRINKSKLHLVRMTQFWIITIVDQMAMSYLSFS